MSNPRPGFSRRTFFLQALAWAGGAAVLAGARRAHAAPQSTESFVGEIMPWSAAFPPRGWAECNGQLLSINQNQALFSILGTAYGGNGVTTFALPDLRGRIPIGAGQGPGLSAYALGERGGFEAQSLTLAELPAHAHPARGASAAGTAAAPAGMVPARSGAGIPQYGSVADVTLATAGLTTAGGNQPHPNLQPYTTIMFVISLSGVFPQP